MVIFVENEMKKFTIKTGTEADFFKRGKTLAKLADQGIKLPAETIVSFEDSADLLRLLTRAPKKFGRGRG